MSGDRWQQFATCAPLFGGCGVPARAALNGGNSARTRNGQHDRSIDCIVVEFPEHGIAAPGQDLGALYRRSPRSGSATTSRRLPVIDAANVDQNTFIFLRRDGRQPGSSAWPISLRHPSRVPRWRSASGRWREVVNTDSEVYGGSNQGNLGASWRAHRVHGLPYSHRSQFRRSEWCGSHPRSSRGDPAGSREPMDGSGG